MPSELSHASSVYHDGHIVDSDTCFRNVSSQNDLDLIERHWHEGSPLLMVCNTRMQDMKLRRAVSVDLEVLNEEPSNKLNFIPSRKKTKHRTACVSRPRHCIVRNETQDQIRHDSAKSVVKIVDSPPLRVVANFRLNRALVLNLLDYLLFSKKRTRHEVHRNRRRVISGLHLLRQRVALGWKRFGTANRSVLQVVLQILQEKFLDRVQRT
mmetsp:Transcript_24306/g.60554  ORF Transcript_24306/g.60554 Transcript_24306/m.60554 type:complete len:210 (+) Transcript_24306:128-757(+)